MKTMLLLAACAAVLTGCAGTGTAVRARAAHDFGAGARSYAFAPDAGRASDEDDRRFAPEIERRLAELGFVVAPEESARYRLALSHDTRPASVGVDYTACAAGAPCGPAQTAHTAGFPWPGTVAYVHSLTLRFFDRADGREAYEVSVTKRDREPDSKLAAAALVTSALARLPFDAAAADKGGVARDSRADWQVTLREAGPQAPPRVTRIAPLHD